MVYLESKYIKLIFSTGLSFIQMIFSREDTMFDAARCRALPVQRWAPEGRGHSARLAAGDGDDGYQRIRWKQSEHHKNGTARLPLMSITEVFGKPHFRQQHVSCTSAIQTCNS